jgi:hypothetical protein
MVIYYRLDDKTIDRTEDNTMTPILPFNKTFDEKVAFYKEQGLGFIAIPQELGGYIWNYNLQFDDQGNFIGLQPKSAT